MAGLKAQKPLHLYKVEAKQLKNQGHLGHQYMIFEKYDGWYGYYEGGKIYSFANREIPSVRWLAEKINDRLGDRINGRLIFEILISGVPHFHTMNGILNRKSVQASDAYLMVHDFLEDGADHRALDRYGFARNLVHMLNLDEVHLAPVTTVTDSVDVWRGICDAIWERGGEGIIAKKASATYVWGGRDESMLKIKCECTFEGVVVGFIEGKSGSKYENTLGALQVRTKDGLIHTVSGMSDTERDAWYKQPSNIVGCVVECLAMQKLPDGNYREPRYKAIRHDKSVTEID